MYRKLVFCLIASGALAMACGDDDDDTPDGESGAGGETAEGGDSSVGGSAARGGNGNAGTAGRGGRGGEAGDDTGMGGSGGTGEACTEADPARCVDESTILACDPEAGDTYQPLSCANVFCPELGLKAGPCVQANGNAACECGEPVDVDCFAGADELCSCFQGTEEECATDGDRYAWYLACLEGDTDLEPIVRCFAEGAQQACSLSVTDCVPE